MAAKLFCPRCGEPFFYVDRPVEAEVTCPGCGAKYLPSAARRDAPKAAPTPEPKPKPIRGYTPPRREPEPEDDFPRVPYRRAYNAAAMRLSTPTAILMVVAFIQALVHILMIVLFLAVGLADARGEDRMFVPVALLVVVLAGAKDYFVIRGVFAMRSTRGYGEAKIGALVGCIPDVGWIFAVIPSIWCYAVLSDPYVRRAFAEHRDAADEYDF